MKKPLTARQSKRTADHKIKQAVAGRVRIIGGQFKRRSVTFIDADGLRPTPDRVRETLFNWLLTDVYSARVLDSCAGSGVLGFEALSRGAAHCTFIETNKAQSELLEQSAQQLQVDADSYRIIQGAAELILSQEYCADTKANQPFDVVFIDPPYAQDLWQPILTALIVNNLISIETIIYLEADKDLRDQLEALALSLSSTLTEQGLNSFECIKQTKVGQVVAGLYRLSSS